ncbi:MAG: hypothetical protein CM15mP98_05370 [Paracoccaceae bacterium]|nr:MAG: hypothetical protein CM15mP98_05370 [Paracoccaceae bacterium]
MKVLCSELNQEKLAGHFHDTSDTAIKNVEVGLKHGVSTFDSAIGGLEDAHMLLAQKVILIHTV